MVNFDLINNLSPSIPSKRYNQEKKESLLKKVLTGIVVIVAISFFFMTKEHKETENGYLYAANFAIYDTLKALAPQSEQVKLFIPAGQDLHSFQPHPKMLVQASLAKKFYYVKGSMSSWLEKLVKQVPPEVIEDLSSKVQWIENEDEDTDEHHHEHEETDHDPHYWLSISNQLAVAEEIARSLKSLYPKKSKEIMHRHSLYKDRLMALDRKSKMLLSHCSNKSIIVTHNAFAYLAKSYDFDIESIAGISPQSMTNPKKMDEIIKKIRSQKYETIFFETFISDILARTIAREAQVDVDVLHPMATLTQEDLLAIKTYADLMEENIHKIAKAMQCH